MRHVLWIGGPAGAGKTTVAKRLARRHGLRWYSADAHTWEHRDRAIREGDEAAIRWETMTPRERLAAGPAEQLELSLLFTRWPMIADDVAALPHAPLVVAEGTTVVPDLVAAGAAEAGRAVWLTPPPGLVRARLEARGTPRSIVAYHALAAAEIDRRARDAGAARVELEPSWSVAETLAEVERRFADALAEGPRAESARERWALLRYANDAVVEQCRAYLARPWADGDPETFARDFACECDDRECETVITLTVAAFERAAAARPVVAGAHR